MSNAKKSEPVTIDPADDEQVGRLASLLIEQGATTDGVVHSGVRDALREFAKPRIDEPGLWGVVKAGTASPPNIRRYWVRGRDGRWVSVADARLFTVRDWDDLLNPTLERPGVGDEPAQPDPESALPDDLIDGDNDVWVWCGNPDRADEPDGYDLWNAYCWADTTPRRSRNHINVRHSLLRAVPHGTGIATVERELGGRT